MEFPEKEDGEQQYCVGGIRSDIHNRKPCKLAFFRKVKRLELS